MHEMLTGLSARSADDAEAGEPKKEYAPAVSVRKSLASPERIISMIDGKPYKTLRRHLSMNGLTPDEYRDRYGLKKDHPIVAPAYSAARQEMAKKIGLGRKPGQRPAAKADLKPSKARDAKTAS